MARSTSTRPSCVIEDRQARHLEHKFSPKVARAVAAPTSTVPLTRPCALWSLLGGGASCQMRMATCAVRWCRCGAPLQGLWPYGSERFGAWMLVLLPYLWQRPPAKCLCHVLFGVWVLVLMQGAAVGLLPDCYGSLSVGACVLVSPQPAAGCRCQMFIAVGDLECGRWCRAAHNAHNIFCYLGSMVINFKVFAVAEFALLQVPVLKTCCWTCVR